MNAGKTLFAQLMDWLPWSTFCTDRRALSRRSLGANLSLCRAIPGMAFAQPTYRESSRDIEACLSARPAKLWHMGFRGPVRRSTLADANQARDRRIYAEFAQRLIARARRLYTGESLPADLDNTVCASESTTIDLCLSLFPCAHFRSTKAAVKMRTLPDFIARQHPRLHSHL
jgi:hypothetical protein